MAPRGLPDDIARSIGKMIEQTREQLGWSRPELAERAGTTTTNIHRMEHARDGGMSLYMIFKLVEAMDCAWRDVLGPEPGSDGGHSTDWESGYRAGLAEAHAAVDRAAKGAQRA